MRILVLGAGGVGGYFGGRLLSAGRDVTFLVRPARAERLKQKGLSIHSPAGNLDLPDPPTVVRERLDQSYDLVLLSCKAYDLEDAMDSVAPAVGPGTSIVPLLNGMRHLDALRGRFGARSIMGGLCTISVSLDEEGRVVHHNAIHQITHGALLDEQQARAAEIQEDLSGAGFDVKLSAEVELDMWEKWVFLAALAGGTCLMRGSVGEIVTAGAGDVLTGMLNECLEIARVSGVQPRPEAVDWARGMLTGPPESTLVASMLRDVESGGRVEGDHVLGDLLGRGDGVSAPLLALAYAHLRVHERRHRAR